MKTNLLLLDSYNNIGELIHFAFNFSNQFKRRLKIIYVHDFNWMSQSAMVGTTGYSSEAMINVERSISIDYEKAEAKIRDIVTDYLKKQSIIFPVDIEVSKSTRVDVINSELEKDPHLMVLISNHQSYSEMTGGLVSYPTLVEHVKCPVLIVPSKMEDSVCKNVVYATDYNPEDIRSLKHLSGLLQQSEKTHLTILHNEKDYDYQAKLKWAGFKNIVQSELQPEIIDFSLITEKDFLTGMEKYDSENNPDLMVILNEEKGFFKDLFTTSNTKNVLTHFDKPLLVYHEK
ncbi:MAG: universal stress protein [Draconibacterium sp.]